MPTSGAGTNAEVLRWRTQQRQLHTPCPGLSRRGLSGHGLAGMVVLGCRFNLMILEVFSNLNDAMISLGSVITHWHITDGLLLLQTAIMANNNKNFTK